MQCRIVMITGEKIRYVWTKYKIIKVFLLNLAFLQILIGRLTVRR